jgi:hypothetical protein
MASELEERAGAGAGVAVEPAAGEVATGAVGSTEAEGAARAASPEATVTSPEMTAGGARAAAARG